MKQENESQRKLERKVGRKEDKEAKKEKRWSGIRRTKARKGIKRREIIERRLEKGSKKTKVRGSKHAK